MDETILVNHCPLKSIDCLSSQHRSHLSLIHMNRRLLCQWWKRSTNSALTKVAILNTFLQSVRACSRLRPKKNTECSNLNEWTIVGGLITYHPPEIILPGYNLDRICLNETF